MHDGSIAGISGSVPGTVALEIDIEYLRERFAEPGTKLILTLQGCCRFGYKPWSLSDEITDLAQIAAKKLEIPSADEDEAYCIVCCQESFSNGGNLKVAFEKLFVTLDQGRPITLDELEQVAKDYWTERAAENRN